MQVYRTHLIVKDSKQITVSNLPFRPGQYVEVLILAQEDRATQTQALKSLFRETQALPQIQAISEAEIAAEVAAYRSGQ